MEQLKPCPIGQWNYPSELPTHKESEIVDCVVIVKGVKTGIVRVENAQYRFGEWAISHAWDLIAWNRRAQPANEPLTLDELREMKVPCPLYKEEPPSGDMTESAIDPVLFKGIHCGKEERACWVTCEAHNANSRIEHIAKGKIKFYRWPPKGSETP